MAQRQAEAKEKGVLRLKTGVGRGGRERNRGG